jgi:hypothetical protein
MQLVTRPWITASVALAGAGVVAVTPLAAPPGPPDVQTHAVKLINGSDPLTEWGDVWQTAEANAQDISDHFSAAPFADVQQEIANDVGYAEDVLKNPSDLSTVLTDIQDNFTAVFGNGTAADPGALWGPFLPDGGATDTLYQSLDTELYSVGSGGLVVLTLNHSDLFGLLTEQIPLIFASDPSLEPLADQLLDFSASPLSGELVGWLGTALSPALQFDTDLININDALEGPTADYTTAFQDLAEIPANVTNAFLNGFGEVNLEPLLEDLHITLPAIPLLGTAEGSITGLEIDLGGLLSPGGSLFNAIGTDVDIPQVGGESLSGVAVGPLASLVELDQSIAEALGWSGAGDPLAGLADAGTSAADAGTSAAEAGSLAADLSTALTSLF